MVLEHGVILAAGRGSRLGQVTADVPKPLLNVAGRPLIDHIVDSFVGAGVTRLTVVTGYRAEALEHHLAARSPVPVSFVRQVELDGTAGALRLVAAAVRPFPFMLGWGDIFTAGPNYVTVAKAWHRGLAAVIGVNPLEDVGSGSSVVFDDSGAVSAIVEKPSGEVASLWNNAGVMAFGPQIWVHMAFVKPSVRGEIELPDAITSMLAAGEQVTAVALSGYWFDIGSSESLQAARQTK